MPPKKFLPRPAQGKVEGRAGTRRGKMRGVRAPPLVQAGPYQSTPKREKKSRGTVAPRNILSERNHSADETPHSPRSKKTDASRRTSLTKENVVHSKSLSKSPPAETPQKRMPPKAKSPTPTSSLSPKKISSRSPQGKRAASGRATPASSPRASLTPATSFDSARRLRSYSHSLRRSIYVPASKLRATSLRESFIKEEKTSPTKASPTLGERRRSVGVIDACYVEAPDISTPHGQCSAVQGHTTPFRAQGPKVARRAYEEKLKQDHGEEQLSLWNDQVKSWLNKAWKLCFLSAMSSFDVHNSNLRSSYRKSLLNKISELLPFNVRVDLETAHCLTYSDAVTDAVVLTISYSVPREWDLRESPKRKKKSQPSERQRILYKSLMIRAILRGSQADDVGVSWYPLYFYSGREKIHQAVEQWLSDSFGACISLKNIRATALLWAAGLWYQQSCRAQLSRPVPVSLVYALPTLSAAGWQSHLQFPSSRSARDSTSFVTLEMSAYQMKELATCVLPESDEVGVTGNERDLFHGIVQQLVRNLTHLPQSALRLCSVRTSCLSLTHNGQVKVSCKRHLLGLLQILLELHRENSLLDQIVDTEYLSQDLDGLELEDH